MRELVLSFGIISTLFVSVFSQVSQAWEKDLFGPYPASADYARAFDIDASGNSYVLMHSFDTNSIDNTPWVACYSASGAEVWRKYYGYPVDSVGKSFFDLVVGNNGNIYIVGSWVGPNLNSALHVEILDSANGNVLDTYTYYDNTPGSYTFGTKARIDANGDIYLLGTYLNYDSLISESPLIVKIDPAGNELMAILDTISYSDSYSLYYLADIKINSTGIYIGGNHDFGSPNNEKYAFVHKFSSTTGTRLYSAHIYQGMTGIEGSSLSQLTVNPQGEVFMAGYIDSTTLNNPIRKALVAKINANGTVGWQFSEGYESWLRAINILSTGEVIAGGFFSDTLNPPDYWAVAYKFGNNGQMAWRNFYPSGANSTGGNYINGIAIGLNNEIFCGEITDELSSFTGIIRLNPANGQSMYRWNKAITYAIPPTAIGGHVSQIRLYGNNTVYYFDLNITTNNNLDGYLTKLNGNFTSLIDENIDGLTIFPNPASDYLYFMLPGNMNNGTATVSLTDIQGREVYQKLIPMQEGMQYTLPVAEFPPGMYVMWVEKDAKAIGREKIIIQ